MCVHAHVGVVNILVIVVAIFYELWEECKAKGKVMVEVVTWSPLVLDAHDATGHNEHRRHEVASRDGLVQYNK